MSVTSDLVDFASLLMLKFSYIMEMVLQLLGIMVVFGSISGTMGVAIRRLFMGKVNTLNCACRP